MTLRHICFWYIYLFYFYNSFFLSENLFFRILSLSRSVSNNNKQITKAGEFNTKISCTQTYSSFKAKRGPLAVLEAQRRRCFSKNDWTLSLLQNNLFVQLLKGLQCHTLHTIQKAWLHALVEAFKYEGSSKQEKVS